MFSLFSVGLCLFKPWSGIRIAFSYRPGGRGSYIPVLAVPGLQRWNLSMIKDCISGYVIRLPIGSKHNVLW